MKRTINSLIIILIVITLILVTFSITYAWFMTSQISGNNSSTSSGKLEIIYDKGQDVNGTLTPSTSKDKGLTTSVKIRQSSSSVNGLATVTLNVSTIDTELAVTGLKWELYKDSESSPISSGNFMGVSSNSKINLIEDYSLTTNDTTFTLYIWLNGDEVDNSVMDKSFSAYINASARSKSANIG